MFRRMILHALLMFVPSVQIRVPWRAPKMLIQAQCRALLSTMFRLVGITGRVQAVQLAVDSRTRRDVTRYVSSARQNQAISVVKSYPTSYQPKTWHWHTHVARITKAVTSCCGPDKRLRQRQKGCTCELRQSTVPVPNARSRVSTLEHRWLTGANASLHVSGAVVVCRISKILHSTKAFEPLCCDDSRYRMDTSIATLCPLRGLFTFV